MEEAENILNYIEDNSIQYVSFDMYDTLLFRSLSEPADVWKLLHRRYEELYGYTDKDIRKIRINAEIFARNRTKKGDVTLEDIYDEICDNGIDKEKLKKLETDIEIEVCILNNETFRLLNEIKSKGTSVIITTDMYLPREIIETILHNNSVEYDALYISGEVGCRKDTGGLFRYIIEDLGIKPDQIIHIGDNEIADFKQAEITGIKGFLYKADRPDITKYFKGTSCGYLYGDRTFINRIRNKIERNIEEKKGTGYTDIYGDYFLGLLNSMCKSQNNNDTRLGFCILGPLVVSLCRWIHKTVIEKGLDQIWFVAREGYLIKEVYLILYPDEKPKIRYVRYNKNLLRLPFALIAETIDEKKALLPSVSTLTIDNLMTLFSLDDDRKNAAMDLIREKTECDNDFMIDIERLEEKPAVDIWNIIIMCVRDKAVEQRKLLEKSLKEAIGKENRRITIALVNNSINGSGQYMLERIIAGSLLTDVKFHGVQMIDSETCRMRGISYSAWLNEIGNHFYRNMFCRTLNIFERILFENCGTALKFFCRDGVVQVECEPRGYEKYNDDLLIPVQNMSKQFALNAWRFDNYDFTEDALKLFFNMMSDPVYEDAKIIGRIGYDEVGESGFLIKEFCGTGWIDLLNQSRREVWSNGFLSLNGAPRMFLKIFVLKCKYLK